jgi:endonuclease G
MKSHFKYLFIGLFCAFVYGCATRTGDEYVVITPLPIAKDMHNNWEPQCLPTIHRSAYSVSYDGRNRNPLWVYQDLTQEALQGEEERLGQQFQEDQEVPTHLRAKLEDYAASGYDRGHMAPAADCKSDQDTLGESFYLTNICPQDPQLNRGFWKKLEKQTRDLTKTYSHVHVVTGPLYLPQKARDGKRYVKYQVIGKNDIAVPTHFFKVLRLEKSPGVVETRAYIVPNEPVASETPLDKFQVSLENVERATGFLFTSPR